MFFAGSDKADSEAGESEDMSDTNEMSDAEEFSDEEETSDTGESESDESGSDESGADESEEDLTDSQWSMQDKAWTRSLPWLTEDNHTTTGAEAAELATYFEENGKQLEVEDDDGQLPLHCAATYQRGEHAVTVVTSLLTAYPRGAAMRDNDGMLPLHCAAENQTGESGTAIVMALLAAFPHGGHQKDDSGRLPADVQHDENPLLPDACIETLRDAAESWCEPLPGRLDRCFKLSFCLTASLLALLLPLRPTFNALCLDHFFQHIAFCHFSVLVTTPYSLTSLLGSSPFIYVFEW